AVGVRVEDDLWPLDVCGIQLRRRICGQDVVAKLPVLEVGRAVTRNGEKRRVRVPVLSEQIVIRADLDHASAVSLDRRSSGGGKLRAVQHADLSRARRVGEKSD